MKNEKEAGPAETHAKSPDTNSTPNFQERFAAELEKWREEGCPRAIEAEGNDAHALCGAPPHGVTMDKPDAAGDVVMRVACAKGHKDVWHYAVPEAEMKTELARQAAAAEAAKANGGKALDPMKASITITLDLKTQEVAISPFVPTPGIGLQMAAILTAHFQKLFLDAMEHPKAPRLKMPTRGLVHPQTGKPLLS